MRTSGKNLYIHLSHCIYILLHPHYVSVTGLGVGNTVVNKQGAAYLTMNKERKSLGDVDWDLRSSPTWDHIHFAFPSHKKSWDFFLLLKTEFCFCFLHVTDWPIWRVKKYLGKSIKRAHVIWNGMLNICTLFVIQNTESGAKKRSQLVEIHIIESESVM